MLQSCQLIPGGLPNGLPGLVVDDEKVLAPGLAILPNGLPGLVVDDEKVQVPGLAMEITFEIEVESAPKSHDCV